MRLTIFLKVALLLVCSIVLVIVSLLYFTDRELSEAFERASAKTMSAATLAVKNIWEDHTESTSAMLWQGSRREDLAKSMAEKDIPTLREIISDMDAHSTIDFITVSDSDGVVLLRSHASRTGDSVKGQLNVRRSLEGVPLTIGVDGGTEIPLSIRGGVPVRYEGKIVGVLTAGVRLDTPEGRRTLEVADFQSGHALRGETPPPVTLHTTPTDLPAEEMPEVSLEHKYL